jgi:hypothetical protein
MRKTIITIVLFISLLSCILLNVKAYSPHYLPGGKNYISSDNIIKTDQTVYTLSPFLVKPYSHYTFSIERSYVDSPYFELNFYFLNDDVYVDEFNLTRVDLEFDSMENIYYYTFLMPAETNYFEFDFVDGSMYVSGDELVGVQLEEGTSYTAYEPYVEGTIIDTTSPYFVGSDTIVSYFDQPITLAEIQSSLTAYDDIDGNLTSNITVKSDNYTGNSDTLGTYQIVFSVSDNSSNTTELTVNVEVVDVLPPVFSEIGKIFAVFPNTYSAVDIKAMLSASDNYDGDISALITYVSDNYIENSEIVGEYQMTFMVTDSSGNSTEYIQVIEVIDDQSPVISGSDSINVGYNQLLTTDIVKSGLSVVDNYDDSQDLEIVLENDTYSSNSNLLGQYEMKFSVTDSSGNKSYKTVDINVVDEIGPIVYFDTSIIQIYSDTIMSLPDFAKLMFHTNELDPEKYYFITTRLDTYTRHYNIPGTYHMHIDFEDEYGEVTKREFRIEVIDRNYDYIYVPQPGLEQPVTTFHPRLLYVLGSSSLLMSSSVGLLVWQLLKRKKIFTI